MIWWSSRPCYNKRRRVRWVVVHKHITYRAAGDEAFCDDERIFTAERYLPTDDPILLYGKQ